MIHAHCWSFKNWAKKKERYIFLLFEFKCNWNIDGKVCDKKVDVIHHGKVQFHGTPYKAKTFLLFWNKSLIYKALKQLIHSWML